MLWLGRVENCGRVDDQDPNVDIRDSARAFTTSHTLRSFISNSFIDSKSPHFKFYPKEVTYFPYQCEPISTASSASALAAVRPNLITVMTSFHTPWSYCARAQFSCTAKLTSSAFDMKQVKHAKCICM
eukprot:2766628-Amphidinium_carterae.1